MNATSSSSVNDRPAVSVIIPTRNCLHYLPAAIASVEAQGLESVEVIAIDDASTDGTGAWLQAKRCTWPSLVVLEGRGGGSAAARNLGIDAARAPLIAFLDADDLWLPGKLASQVIFHRTDPEIVFSFTDYLHVDAACREHGTCFEYSPTFRRLVGPAARTGARYRRLPNAAAHLLAENVVCTSTVVVRQDLLQNVNGFDVDLRSAENWDLWLRLANVGPVGFTPDVGADHLVRRPGSASADARLRIACMRRILAAHAPSIVLSPQGAKAVRRARGQILATEAELALAEGRYLAAAKAYWARFGRHRRTSVGVTMTVPRVAHPSCRPPVGHGRGGAISSQACALFTSSLAW